MKNHVGKGSGKLVCSRPSFRAFIGVSAQLLLLNRLNVNVAPAQNENIFFRVFTIAILFVAIIGLIPYISVVKKLKKTILIANPSRVTRLSIELRVRRLVPGRARLGLFRYPPLALLLEQFQSSFGAVSHSLNAVAY